MALTPSQGSGAYVAAEGLWAKAQKNASYDLRRYATTGDKKYYDRFEKQLNVTLGAKKARLELEKATPDIKAVYEGFAQNGSNPKIMKIWPWFSKDSII